MKRPLIGVVPLWDELKNSYWMLPGYLKGIEAAGGIPITLPLTGEAAVARQLCETIDGVLFTGGHDVSPALYGQKKLDVCDQGCAERDDTERLLFLETLRLDMPALGICRGIQLFNVLLGGSLYQDIPLQTRGKVIHAQKHPYCQPSHIVKLVSGTPLHTLLRESSISVNSCHHQGICALASELAIMAQAPDGLAEAVYMPVKTFVWAVQWHPEFALNDPVSRALFSEFVLACIKYKSQCAPKIDFDSPELLNREKQSKIV